MSVNYKFFQHKECEYFPCHTYVAEDKFNCIMCYCPLYNYEECGGRYFILDNGIKDCSTCPIPHTIEGYDYIVNKIKDNNNARI